MKKLFKFALVAFAAAAVTVACQPANQPTTPDKPDTPDTPDTPDKPDTPDEVVPVEGTADWAIIGTLLGSNWDKDYKSAQDGDIYVVKNVKLEAATEFKWRDTTSEKDGWAVNRGGAFTALGEAFDVTQDGANIKPGLDGVYDIYLNLAVDQAAIVAKDGAQPTWKEVTPDPVATNWDYVMDISNYMTNSEFHFTDPIKVNTSNMTFQWKFYSNGWNKADHSGKDENGKTLWANRLGQICNTGEKGILHRFSNGGKDGQLQINMEIFGLKDKYVPETGDAYIWPTNEWHTVTVTADGTTVTVYDNEKAIATYKQETPEVYEELPIERFDISMTWDDGSEYPRGQAFNGYIAYTRLWSKALSAEEIAGSLCDAPADAEGLEICWNWNADEGTSIKNLGKAGSKYDLDFTKALGAGQSSYVKATDIEGTWTSVEGIAPVCAE